MLVAQPPPHPSPRWPHDTGAVMPGLPQTAEVEVVRTLRLAVLRTPSLARRFTRGDDAREVGGGHAAEDAVGSGDEAGMNSPVSAATS